MPAASIPRSSAIVVVRDAVLAASLELALLASGMNAFLFDAKQGLDRLPLNIAMTLIIDDSLAAPDPATFAAGLRAKAWDGLIVLITDDGELLREAVRRSERVAVLEMPFVGADLIGAIQAVWPPEPSAP